MDVGDQKFISRSSDGLALRATPTGVAGLGAGLVGGGESPSLNARTTRADQLPSPMTSVDSVLDNVLSLPATLTSSVDPENEFLVRYSEKGCSYSKLTVGHCFSGQQADCWSVPLS